MKSSRAHIAALGLATVLAATTLTACASNAADAGPVELTFLANNTPNLTAEFWESNIERFEADHPGITVTLVQAPNSDTTSYAQQLAGTGQLPDLQTGLQVSQFVEAGQLLPFEEGDLKAFSDPMAGSIGGKQYQLPVASIYAPVMYYNKALFAASGVEVPTTWDEFLEVCATLKAAGVTPLEVGGNDAPTLTATLMDYLISVDVLSKTPDWVEKRASGEVSFTDDNVVDALSKFQSLVEAGYVSSDALSVPFATSQQRFLDSASAAMYPTGSWFSATADGAGKGDEFGVFGLPGSGNLVIPAVTGGGVSISAATKHPEEARAFAVWLNTDEQYLAATAKTDAQMPNKKTFVLDRASLGPLFLATIDLAEANETVQSFGFAWGGASVPGPVGTELGVQVQNILSGTSDAKAAAEALEKAWNQ